MSGGRFECSICLDVFTDPVTTPCGHNFCQGCITRTWADGGRCQCPLCNKTYQKRPELQINREFREVVEHFKETRLRGEEPTPVRPGEVPCDVCLEPRLVAQKTCLVCQTSYCQTHLEPHYRVAVLKMHKLINPLKNLEDRMCKKHNKILEFFCRRDQMCVCSICLSVDHKSHDAVPLDEEYENKKVQLDIVKKNVRQMLETRSRKVQEIKHSIEQSKGEVDEEIADCVAVIDALLTSIESRQAELIGLIEEKHRAAETQAEGFLEELDDEILALELKNLVLEQISNTEDHPQLLQSFQTLSALPQTKVWSEVSVQRQVSVGTVRRAMARLRTQDTVDKELEKVIREVGQQGVPDAGAGGGRTAEDKLAGIQQQCAVDVTLDAESVNPFLILSEDGRQVRHGGTKRNLINNIKRFDCFLGVTGGRGFRSGRFYYEVQVRDKTVWTVGVAKASISRKGWTLGLLSPEYGCWTVGLREGDTLRAFTNKTPTDLLLRCPEKVGVFVSYEDGEVSFYDVGTRDLIYSFTGCAFSEMLYPFLSPGGNMDGKNSAPLVITPVRPGC